MKLILITLVGMVVGMILACSSEPAATPTPAGPMYSEEEAISILKEHLQAKPVPIGSYPFMCFQFIGGDSVAYFAVYDNESHRWDVRGGDSSWSVYERTKSIVATGDGFC